MSASRTRIAEKAIVSAPSTAMARGRAARSPNVIRRF